MQSQDIHSTLNDTAAKNYISANSYLLFGHLLSVSGAERNAGSSLECHFSQNTSVPSEVVGSHALTGAIYCKVKVCSTKLSLSAGTRIAVILASKRSF